MRALALLLATAGVALGACQSSGIDPAARANLDKKLAQIAVSEETFPPSEIYSPLPFAAGQWTQHRIVDDKNQTSLLTFKLLAQERGGYLIETVNETYQGREIVKMFVVLRAGRDPSGMEILEVRFKRDAAAPVEVEGEARKQFHDTLDLLATNVDSHEKDDARVPAGHFIGCYRLAMQGSWGPWNAPTSVCAHPSVPLSGIVTGKPEGKAGLIELVAFGLSGADSEIK